MTDRRETAAIIALLRHPDVTWTSVADDVEEAGSAVTVLDEMHRTAELTLLDDAPDIDGELDVIAREVEAWEAEGMHLVTVLDGEGYPENLRTVHDRPPVLFVRGNLEQHDGHSVAVVGTRTATERGLRQAEDAATGLVEAGYVVVSGLARGIDTAAHRAALSAGGRTLAVIGTGLRRSYPKENVELQGKLAEHSAVISQFWPDQPPGKHTFPLRNAVMSGFALATLVVEAAHTSGARMQARLALEHGRPVFLQQTLLKHEWATRYADRPGTYVVEGVDEVVHHLDRLYAYDVTLTT